MWEELEFDAEKIPLFKLIAHCTQILLVFILWCLEITVFRADGAAVNGNNGWTFAVVSLVASWISSPPDAALSLASLSSLAPGTQLTLGSLFLVVFPLDPRMGLPHHDPSLPQDPSICLAAGHGCSRCRLRRHMALSLRNPGCLQLG